MRGGPRVLILPGIMGSTHRAPAQGPAATTSSGSIPTKIALGRHRASSPCRAAAASGRWVSCKFAYERLRLVLRIAGYDAAFHPYDWRLDLASNGRELADRLERERRQDVVLIGHSMGGLVARAALAHKGATRIARVIQLGAPNRGVFVAIQALRGHLSADRRVCDAGPGARRR